MFELEWHGRELKAEVQRISEKVVKDSAKRIKRNAKSNVAKRSGALAKSIDYFIWKRKGVVGAVIEAGEKGNVHIAGFVELGTPGELIRDGKNKGKPRRSGPIKAGPYMRPALKRDKNRLLRGFSNKL
jgi:HK97 gp10 family phage protein